MFVFAYVLYCVFVCLNNCFVGIVVVVCSFVCVHNVFVMAHVWFSEYVFVSACINSSLSPVLCAFRRV